VGEIPARRHWSGSQISLPAGVTRPGVNWLSFCWPVPGPDVAACLDSDAAALACGGFPAVLPVFGEIYHAVLTAAG
jgi:hypothetical protein